MDLLLIVARILNLLWASERLGEGQVRIPVNEVYIHTHVPVDIDDVLLVQFHRTHLILIAARSIHLISVELGLDGDVRQRMRKLVRRLIVVLVLQELKPTHKP